MNIVQYSLKHPKAYAKNVQKNIQKSEEYRKSSYTPLSSSRIEKIENAEKEIRRTHHFVNGKLVPKTSPKSKALSKAKGVITKKEAVGIKKTINSALKD